MMQAPDGPTSGAAPTTSRRPYTRCARQPRMTKPGPGWLTHSRRCRRSARPWTPSGGQGGLAPSRPPYPAADCPLSRRRSARFGHHPSKRLKGDDMAARDDGPPQGNGAADAGGAPAGAARRQRWLARLAFIGAAAVVTVVLLSGALRSIAVLLLGLAGLAVTCAAAWWFLAHRGVLRWLALAVLVAAPVVVSVML